MEYRMYIDFYVNFSLCSELFESFLAVSIFRRLRAYESHMSTVALSNVESARTVSQILYEMANASDF